MGSDSSKPVAPKAPTDPDPVGTRTFSDSFPEPGTYEAFCSHIGLPVKGQSVVPEGLQPGDRVHLEAEQSNLQDFGVRFFGAFAHLSQAQTVPPAAMTDVVSKNVYVKLMKQLYGSNYQARLDFVLSFYQVLDHDDTYLDVPSATTMFSEIIALYTQLHAKEETQIQEYGYLPLEEEKEPPAPKTSAPAEFAPLKETAKDPSPQTTRPKPAKREEEEILGDTFEPEKPKVVYNHEVSVPKHKTEDVLPSSADQEAQLVKEILERRAAEKAKSAKIEQFNQQIVLSLVSTAFKAYMVDVLLTPVEERSKLRIRAQEMRSWLLSYLPKAGDVLLALIRLSISAKLSATVSDLEKKHYQRAAPIPDGVNMSSSLLWCPSVIWAIHHHFDLKNIGSFKMLYSSTQHGRSLNRFVHHTVGYKAETLFIIYTAGGEIFGTFVPTPWEVSGNYWSNSNCFLFGLSPILSVRHPQPKGQSNYAYFFTNSKSFSGKPVGIGFGGTPGNFRLFVDEDLMTGTVRTMDPTFETGPITTNPAFNIACIEVWGSATDYAEQGLLRERRLREKDQERARKAVDKGQSWNDGPDKFIMDLVGRTGASDGVVEQNERERRQAREKEEKLAEVERKMNAGKYAASSSSSTD